MKRFVAQAARAVTGRSSTARARREGGAVLVIVALGVVALVTATSFAVDVGRLSARRRDLQKAADLMSLDLVRQLNGASAAALAGTPAVQAAAASSATNNGFAATTCPTAVTFNSFDCSGAGAVSFRVTFGSWSGAFTPAPSGAAIPNAVQVRAGDTVKYFFAAASVSTSRSAVSARDKTASFGLGTSLATLATSGSPLLAPLLNGLLGGNVSLDIVTYQGIANANVKLLSFLDALGTELGVGAGNVDQVLAADATVGQILSAAASALSADGNGNVAASINGIVASLSTSPILNQAIKLGDVLDLGTDTTSAAATASLNALDLLNLVSTAARAQLSNGQNAVSVDLPGVKVNLGPGLNVSALEVTLTVIEPPKFRYDAHVGEYVHTAQVKIAVKAAEAHVDTGDPNVVTQILGPLGSLVLGLLGPLGLANLHVGVGPVTLNAAAAQGTATLRDITCPAPSGTTTGFTLGVLTSGAGIVTDIPLDVSLHALLGLLNIQVVGGALEVTQSVADPSSERPISFSFPPDQPGTPKDTGPGSLIDPNAQVDSSSLTVAGLPLGVILNGLLAPTGLVGKLLTGLESAIIHPLESALGLELASGTAFAGLQDPVVKCKGPHLVR